MPSRVVIRLLSGMLLLVAACQSPGDGRDFVARVGDAYLTVEEVGEAARSIGPVLDSSEAARRYVEQWVTQELLYREASRRGLRNEPDVRKLIDDSERSVLTSALLKEVYASSEAGPSQSDIEAYFETHRDQLGLLEPFVRVRYLAVADADSARLAQRRLAVTDTADVENWASLVRVFAIDPEPSLALSASYAAEERLFSDLPRVREALSVLIATRTAPVIEELGVYHVLQLVDRVPAGTVPRIAWIEETLRQRLQIEMRKQLYARLVQDLRNEALSRQALELR